MTVFAVPFLVLVLVAQTPAAPLQLDAVREFLRAGKVVSIKTLSKGVTRPRRVTLKHREATGDAVFQSINVAKPIERFSSGKVELDFRDSYHFNIAAFELARLIGIEAMVPPCVERAIQYEKGSLCWWVPWKWDEQMRIEQKLQPPDQERWQRQWATMRVFRELVDDSDRNQTNMLISEDWHLWMVDFSRAFRKSDALRRPAELRQCPEAVLARLRALDPAAVKKAVGRHLLPGEIAAVLKRRDALVAHFDAQVSERGAASVLF